MPMVLMYHSVEPYQADPYLGRPRCLGRNPGPR